MRGQDQDFNQEVVKSSTHRGRIIGLASDDTSQEEHLCVCKGLGKQHPT